MPPTVRSSAARSWKVDAEPETVAAETVSVTVRLFPIPTLSLKEPDSAKTVFQASAFVPKSFKPSVFGIRPEIILAVILRVSPVASPMRTSPDAVMFVRTEEEI